MAPYCTCQTDHRPFYALHSLRVHHALHVASVEILAVYSVRNLGGKEPEGQVVHAFRD